jgi:hypothetical protein
LCNNKYWIQVVKRVGILVASLSLMSFTYAAPRGYSENEFMPDEEWNLEYFIQGLEFEYGCLTR